MPEVNCIVVVSFHGACDTENFPFAELVITVAVSDQPVAVLLSALRYTAVSAAVEILVIVNTGEVNTRVWGLMAWTCVSGKSPERKAVSMG